jgi:hypothetical protein
MKNTIANTSDLSSSRHCSMSKEILSGPQAHLAANPQDRIAYRSFHGTKRSSREPHICIVSLFPGCAGSIATEITRQTATEWPPADPHHRVSGRRREQTRKVTVNLAMYGRAREGIDSAWSFVPISAGRLRRRYNYFQRSSSTNLIFRGGTRRSCWRQRPVTPLAIHHPNRRRDRSHRTCRQQGGCSSIAVGLLTIYPASISPAWVHAGDRGNGTGGVSSRRYHSAEPHRRCGCYARCLTPHDVQ